MYNLFTDIGQWTTCVYYYRWHCVVEPSRSIRTYNVLEVYKQGVVKYSFTNKHFQPELSGSPDSRFWGTEKTVLAIFLSAYPQSLSFISCIAAEFSLYFFVNATSYSDNEWFNSLEESLHIAYTITSQMCAMSTCNAIDTDNNWKLIKCTLYKVSDNRISNRLSLVHYKRIPFILYI